MERLYLVRRNRPIEYRIVMLALRRLSEVERHLSGEYAWLRDLYDYTIAKYAKESVDKPEPLSGIFTEENVLAYYKEFPNATIKEASEHFEVSRYVFRKLLDDFVERDIISLNRGKVTIKAKEG